MDEQRKQQTPSLVCTCNDLYINHIKDAIDEGETDYVEIMQYNDTLPRCGECDVHVQSLVDKSHAMQEDISFYPI